jgi:hypothetical protein
VVNELVNNILALKHFVGIPVDLGQLQGGMLVLLQLPAALALVQLDEALPCLGIARLEVGGSKICALGLVDLALLVERECQEYVST